MGSSTENLCLSRTARSFPHYQELVLKGPLQQYGKRVLIIWPVMGKQSPASSTSHVPVKSFTLHGIFWMPVSVGPQG